MSVGSWWKFLEENHLHLMAFFALMKIPIYPSIEQFRVFVELKDFRPPTKKEYVRYVRKLAEHFQCDPASLSEDPLAHEGRQVFHSLLLPRKCRRAPGSLSMTRTARMESGNRPVSLPKSLSAASSNTSCRAAFNASVTSAGSVRSPRNDARALALFGSPSAIRVATALSNSLDPSSTPRSALRGLSGVPTDARFLAKTSPQVLRKALPDSQSKSQDIPGLVQPVIASTLRTRSRPRHVSHSGRVLRSMLCVLR